MRINEIWSSSAAHRPPMNKPFFEGWLFKLVTAGGKVLSFIPGISKDGEGNDCAFIQAFAPNYLCPTYYEADIRRFHARSHPFEINFEDNRFTQKGLKVRLSGNGNTFEGLVRFKNMVLLDRSLLNPGIMGPFSFVPGLSCWHEVLSLRHELEGQIVVNGEVWDFEGGVGYIDKDWGLSFPNHLFWVQAGQFESDRDLAVTAALARVNVAGTSVPGVLCVLYYKGQQYRFCTYNGAFVLNVEKVGEQKIEVKIKKGRDILTITVHYSAINTLLPAPHMGSMRRKGVQEHHVEKLHISLTRDGAPLLEDCSTGGAMQITGDYSKLT